VYKSSCLERFTAKTSAATIPSFQSSGNNFRRKPSSTCDGDRARANVSRPFTGTAIKCRSFQPVSKTVHVQMLVGLSQAPLSSAGHFNPCRRQCTCKC
jgi:hypothetical protein